MKSLVASFALISLSGMAIEFITEEQVAQQLKADKVIEVSKYAVETLIDKTNNCDELFDSRSARTYVVKKGKEASLYLTPSGLSALVLCKKL